MTLISRAAVCKIYANLSKARRLFPKVVISSCVVMPYKVIVEACMDQYLRCCLHHSAQHSETKTSHQRL